MGALMKAPFMAFHESARGPDSRRHRLATLP